MAHNFFEGGWLSVTCQQQPLLQDTVGKFGRLSSSEYVVDATETEGSRR